MRKKEDYPRLPHLKSGSWWLKSGQNDTSEKENYTKHPTKLVLEKIKRLQLGCCNGPDLILIVNIWIKHKSKPF